MWHQKGLNCSQYSFLPRKSSRGMSPQFARSTQSLRRQYSPSDSGIPSGLGSNLYMVMILLPNRPHSVIPPCTKQKDASRHVSDVLLHPTLLIGNMVCSVFYKHENLPTSTWELGYTQSRSDRIIMSDPRQRPQI